jgi:hypothetical protein
VAKIIRTEEADAWLKSLPRKQANRIGRKIALLEQTGSTLGRPHADTLKGSRVHNMKELRAGSLRLLFAFDRRGRGVLLVGGDKSGKGNRWYPKALGRAENLFAAHQRNSGEVQRWQTTTRTAGARSAERSR